jgi:FRG domain
MGGIEPNSDKQAPSINELSEYIKFLESNYSTDDYYLFRGQREDWDLLPKLCRVDLIKVNILASEKAILRDFNLEAASYFNPKPNNDWDLLSIAQHHGLPTRLLDWTKNPLAALWFAVKEPALENKYGVVWVLKAGEKDIITDTESSKPFEGARTNVFEPNHIAARIKAQDGAFTVHKYIEKSSSFLALNKNNIYKQQLRKIIIPADAFSNLRCQLHRCGVHAASLFPGLDGLAEFITWRHSRFADDAEKT